MDLFTKRLQLYAVTCWLACAFTTSSISAHPFHTSVAELDWNAASGRWEVSVRIHAGDLELALAKQLGRQLDIESSQAAQWIQQYVASRFRLVPQAAVEGQEITTDNSPNATSEKPDSSRIDWVGQEVEGGWMWLYFELLPPKSELPLALVSQLLTEINEDQINIVSIRNAAKKRSTQQTSRKQAWLALPATLFFTKN